MSALASMTGLTGWLELNKQGDSSGRLVTKVLFLGYCTVSLFGGETELFWFYSWLIILLYRKLPVPFEDYAIWDHTYVAWWFFNCLISLWRLLSRAFAKKKPTLQASWPHGKESKILDTTPRIPDFRARFLTFCQWNLDFNLESALVRGIDSLSFIPGSKAHDSSFHKSNSLTWGDWYFKWFETLIMSFGCLVYLCWYRSLHANACTKNCTKVI